MKTKFPKGSQGAAEQKSANILRVFLSVATFLVFLATFAFDTQLKMHMENASTLMNIVGSLFFTGSIVSLWLPETFLDIEARTRGLIWIGGLALGILFSCGFNFGY